MPRPRRTRLAKALRLGRRGIKAAAGDPRALARLGLAATRRVPKALRWLAAAVVAVTAVAASSSWLVTGVDEARGDPLVLGAGPGAPFGAGDRVWTAYQLAASVICERGGGSMLWPPDVDTQPEGDRVDWRLVAAVGQVVSLHGQGGAVDGFGDMAGRLVGAVGRPDTDGGRFDGSGAGDAPVGLLGLWPSEIVAAGLDGNGDEIVDPHNVWDSVATAAGELCTRGAATDPVAALLAWRGDREWTDRVLAVWNGIADAAPRRIGGMPPGAPLAYTPRTAGGGGPGLASLLDRWPAAVPAVACEGGLCGVKLGFVPEAVAGWGGLLEAGFAAPAAVPGWGVTVTGDAIRHARIHPWAGHLSWLFPSSSPPQPARYSPPAWWTFALAPTSARWTEPTDGYWLRIPAAAGTTVYAPTDGIAEYHAGGCVEIHDGDEALWTLCGVYAHPGGSAPPRSGPLQRLLRDWPELERAAHLPPPARLINLGTFACRTVHASTTWSQHSWNNAVDVAVDVDGDLQRSQHDMDSAITHEGLSRLTLALARTMHNPHTSILADGSTLIQDQAPQLGRYQLRNLIFNFDYEPGTAVSVVRHDEHLHADFWVGPQPAEPDCSPHEVTAGEGLGVAPSGAVRVAVSGPEGTRLCPQVLFGEWQRGNPLTPAALEAEILAGQEAADEGTPDGEDTDEPDSPDEPEGCDE